MNEIPNPSDMDRPTLPEPAVVVSSDPPAALPAKAVAEAGPIVLLLGIGPDRAWTAETAIALAGAVAQQGRRVVLADLDLERPALHERLGVPNLEGVADVFLYGASLSRSARPVPDRGFYFMASGTYTTDPSAVFAHPRWSKLASGFADADASLLLYLPADGAGVAALARHADAVVVLGDPARLDGALPDLPVLAVLVPEPPAPVTAPAGAAGARAADTLPTGEPGRALDAEPPEGPAGPDGAAAGPGPRPPVVVEDEAVSEDVELLTPPTPPRARRKRRGASILLWVLLVAVLLAAAGYLLATTRPELVPWLQAAPEAELQPAVSAEPPLPPVALGDSLPWSVQVAAYDTPDAAARQLQRLEDEFPEAAFLIAPESVDGTVFYKILAGLLPDTAAAAELRSRLRDQDLIPNADQLGSFELVRHTPLAFELGEYPTREAAIAARDSLAARGMFSYPVAQPYSDGSQRWRLFGGAYRDSASAEHLRQELAEAGLTPELAARVGLRPVVQK